MDVLVNFMNFLNKKHCFLCFKKCENLDSITKKHYIYYEDNNTTTCVQSMMMYLFPTREILSEEVCQDCIKLILSMYVTLHRHDTKKQWFRSITDDMLKSTREDIKDTHQPLSLHVNVPESAKELNKNNTSTMNISESVKLDSQNLKQFNVNPKNEATICDVCGKVCKTPNSLKQNLNCHSQESCPYCLKVLKTHAHFKLHVKGHEGIKKKRRKKENFYYCNDCEYRSLNKCSFQAHMNKYHLKVRPFICEICSKGFYKKSNLTEHVLTHKNEKTLICEQCGENFVYKKTLIDHLRLHAGVRPFQCSICQANFVTSGRRSDHMKRKHGEKGELCHICCKTFSLKKDLNSHIKRAHVVLEGS